MFKCSPFTSTKADIFLDVGFFKIISKLFQKYFYIYVNCIIFVLSNCYINES